MRKVIFVINILMTLFIFGCSMPYKQSLYNLGERQVSRKRIYNNSFEEIWKACENILQESKDAITINAIDKASGLLTYTQSGVPDIENISAGVSIDAKRNPFKNTTPKETTIHVNMLLTPINDKRTKVIIHSLFRTPYSHQLFSTGLFEEELFKKIELKLGGTGK